jgi:hypothetical protein
MDLRHFKSEAYLSANPFANFDAIHARSILRIEDFERPATGPKHLTPAVISPEFPRVQSQSIAIKSNRSIEVFCRQGNPNFKDAHSAITPF